MATNPVLTRSPLRKDAMSPACSASDRTILARLIRERHWTSDDFQRAYAATARSLSKANEERRVPPTVSDRQAKRWISGAITSRPYPAACRVLEESFTFPWKICSRGITIATVRHRP
jgi:hypothetical protein